MKKITYLILSVLATFCGACSEDIGDYAVHGEALTSFDAQSPVSNFSVTVNKSTPEATVDFSWKASTSGLNSPVTYKILFNQPNGDFSAPIYSVTSANEGKATTVAVTYSQLEEIAGKLTAKDSGYEISWCVEASNPSGVKKYTLPTLLKLNIPAVGVTPLQLNLPEDAIVIALNKITKPNEKITFKWEKSTASDGSAIQYQFFLGLVGDNFENPVISTPATDTDSASFTTKELNKAFNEAGYTSIDMVLEWKVAAIVNGIPFTSEIRQFALSIQDIPNLYLVGDATNAGWDTKKGIALNKISDGVFSGIVKLKNSGGWKVIATIDSWDPAWGTNDTDPMNGELDGTSGCPNIPAPATEATYKITLDFANMTYKVETLPSYSTLFMVGDGCSAGWSPTQGVALGKAGDYKFETYATLNNGGIKFLPTNTDWTGDWGMKPQTPGTLLQDGEANIEAESGYYHIIVDFENLQYQLVPVTSWGIIGDATPGGWDTETPMVFDSTTGHWTLDNVTFADGKFKFRANNGWDLNYGAGNKENELKENGGDISVQAGTYTVVLDLTTYPYTYQLTLK